MKLKLQLRTLKNACLPIGTSKSQEKLASVQDGTLEELTKAIALDDMSVINNAEKFITEILGLNKKK